MNTDTSLTNLTVMAGALAASSVDLDPNQVLGGITTVAQAVIAIVGALFSIFKVLKK
jgi:hypothetical protein